MSLFAENFDAPWLMQRVVAEITEVPSTTLDLWVRDGVLKPYRLTRKDRLYSTEQAVAILLIRLLVDSFRLRPTGARDLAHEAISAYRQTFPADVEDMESGASWDQPGFEDKAEYADGYTRDSDGRLRRTEPGDDPTATIKIVLPVRLVARRFIDKILSHKRAAEATAQAPAEDAA
jgi:hypothetical protein